MSEDEQLETLINQTLDGAISAIPMQMDEVSQNKDILKVENEKEFAYGLIMGMALGLGSAFLTTQKGVPTAEDQLKVRDIVYRKIPDIRKRIFE